ncbi:MAG: HAD family phosphatase, partial [Ruminococcaceae bacterium]|nr:HAD family phosphatase [Oscillospiraceae bacterium]
MQNYKIVSADLDSTLLSSDMTVSRENEEAIHALAQQGVHFVPNTGRTFGEIPEAVKQNPDIRYIIYSDGSAIYDKQSDTTKGAYLPRELYLRMLSLLKEYEALSSVRTGGVSYVDANQFTEECMIYHQVGKYYRDFLFETNVPVEKFDEFCQGLDDIEMICTFFHDDEDCKACIARLEQMGGVMIVSSMVHNIEILSTDAGKGNA